MSFEHFAQHFSLSSAAKTGVLLHAMAGDLAATDAGERRHLVADRSHATRHGGTGGRREGGGHRERSGDGTHADEHARAPGRGGVGGHGSGLTVVGEVAS